MLSRAAVVSGGVVLSRAAVVSCFAATVGASGETVSGAAALSVSPGAVVEATSTSSTSAVWELLSGSEGIGVEGVSMGEAGSGESVRGTDRSNHFRAATFSGLISSTLFKNCSCSSSVSTVQESQSQKRSSSGCSLTTCCKSVCAFVLSPFWSATMAWWTVSGTSGKITGLYPENLAKRNSIPLLRASGPWDVPFLSFFSFFCFLIDRRYQREVLVERTT